MKIKTLVLILMLAAVMAPNLSFAAGKEILMVVTSADRMKDGKPTGLWLEEYAVPYLKFTEAGYKVTVASIKGGKAPVDARSVTDATQVYRWAGAIVRLENTVAVGKVQAKRFDAIFIPGGHGTMFDLPGNPDLKRLLKSFAVGNKVIAAVCHGPAAFVGVKKADGSPLVAGKTVTAFTDAEETAINLQQAVPFLLESRLREEGAKFVVGEKWASHVQVDGKLVTGQNPASSEAAALAVLKLLK